MYRHASVAYCCPILLLWQHMLLGSGEFYDHGIYDTQKSDVLYGFTFLF